MSDQVSTNPAVRRLVADGVMRFCASGCGNVFTPRVSWQLYCSKYCASKSTRKRMSIRKRANSHNEPKPRKDAEIWIAARQEILSNARIIYNWILGDSGDGGKRLWFNKHDIFAAGITPNIFDSGHSSQYMKIISGLLAAGLIERRRYIDKNGDKGNRNPYEYRLLKVDIGFARG